MPALLIRGAWIVLAGVAAGFGFKAGDGVGKGLQYAIAGAGAYVILKYSKVIK